MACTQKETIPNSVGIILKPIEENIYHVHIDSRYDLAMAVCRMSEWGECPSKQFRRQNFSMEDYMRWYAHVYGSGSFTYPSDWTGFNITSQEVEAVAGMGLLGGKLAHSSFEIAFFAKLKEAGIYEWGNPIETPFSILCTSKSNTRSVLSHELAHGRWHTNKEYKKTMRAVVRAHEFESRPLVSWLKKAGYSANLYEDETHAYALTGWPDGLDITDNLLTVRHELLAAKRKLVRDGIIRK